MRQIAFPPLFLLLLMPLQAQDAKRPMTVDDDLNIVDVGQTAIISPDGQWVLYSRSELDWKKNERKTTYHRIPSQGGESFQYIGEEGGRSFEFSPQGTYLSFVRQVGEGKDRESQVFLMRTQGGEAVQLTKHKGGINSYRWAQDESRIFFVAAEQLSEDEQKRRKDGDDGIFVDEGPNGQERGEWNNLWVFELASKKEDRLTDEKFRIGQFDVSPDASRIVLTARYGNRRNQQYLAELFLVDVASKSKSRLTENRAPESRPLWAPDGKVFAYSAPDDQEWELRNGKIWVMNPDNLEHRMVSGGFEGNIGSYHWTPDSKGLVFSALQRTDSNLYRLDVASGGFERLTDLQGNLSLESLSKDQLRYVYSFSDFDSPSDLYVGTLSGGQPIRLTEANPWVEKDLQLAKGQVIRWKSKDGLEIEGLLFLPSGYTGEGALPLMLNIHGGPAGVFSNSFRAMYHIYAGLGYVSLSPNVRGSSGYSDDLLRGNMADIGGGDYQDLMTGVDHLIQQGIADPGRLALRGWSYGGILGGWTITQTDRFKAASVGAMVSDWTSEYGPGFNHDVRLWYIGGTPWENPEGYRQKSALTHVANVTTPTIILHGINDTTDTEPQSMMFFAALKDRGVDVRYIRYPREPHGFREPRHQRSRDIEEIRWMQKYVFGQEWIPWEREEDKKKEEKKGPMTEVETQNGG